MDAIDKYIDDKVNAEIANLAATVEAAMDANAFNSVAAAHQTSGNETVANVADSLVSNNQNTIFDALKAIDERLDKVEK